jgi:hypothetical protein
MPEASSLGRSEQQVLASVLAAGFALDRLRALGSASLNAAALPTLILWIAAWVRLPALVVWLAVAIWAACAGLAIVCAASESRFRRRYEAALPASRPLARVSFSSAAPSRASTVLAALAAVLSSLLWLNAWAPLLVPAEPLAFVRLAWAILVAATVVARWRELGT